MRVSRLVLGLTLIAIVISAVNTVYLYNLSSDLTNLKGQVEIVVDNQRIILEQPQVAAFMAAYKEKGQLLLDAKKEGKLSVYYFLLTEQGLALIDGFKKAYPWMDVQYYRAPGQQLIERVISESAAGKNIADLVINDIASLDYLKGQSMLGSYNSSVAAFIPSPPAFKDKEQTFISILLYQMSMAVNTKFVNSSLAPKDWTDWTNPRPEWKDKVSIGDFRYLGNSYLTLYGIYTKYGPDTTNKILLGLKASNVRIWPGSAQGSEWAVTGERPLLFQIPVTNFLGMGVSSLLKEAGGPLTWITPKSGVVVWSVGQAILKAAPHPNAAKLFYDFVLSKDGQAIIERIGYGAVRPDVPADPAYAYYYSTIMKGVPIIAFDEVQAGIDRPKLIAEWAAIVGLS